MRLSINERVPKACLAIALAMLAAAPLLAGSAVRGVVREPSGAPIAGARVLIDCGYGTLASATDALGTFRISDLSPGLCAVSAEAVGHASLVMTTVTLSEGMEAPLEFELAPSADEESVTMTRETPLLGRTASDRQSLARDETAMLPMVAPSSSILRFVPSILLFDPHREPSGEFSAGLTSDESALWSFRGVLVDERAVRAAGAPMIDLLEEAAIVRDGGDTPLELVLSPKRGSGHRGSVLLAYTDASRAEDGVTAGVEGGGAVVRDRLWAWASVDAIGFSTTGGDDRGAVWGSLDLKVSPQGGAGASVMMARTLSPSSRSDLELAGIEHLQLIAPGAQVFVRASAVQVQQSGGLDVDDAQFEAIGEFRANGRNATHDLRFIASHRSLDGSFDADLSSFTIGETATRGNGTLAAFLRYDRQASGRDVEWESWSPRLSGTWLLERTRRTLFFASWGRGVDPISGRLYAGAPLSEDAPRRTVARAGFDHEIIPELMVTAAIRDEALDEGATLRARGVELIAAKRISNGLLARGYAQRQWISGDARNAGVPDARWLYNVSVALQLPSAWTAAFIVRGNDGWTMGCDGLEGPCGAVSSSIRGTSDAAIDVRLGRAIRVGPVEWLASFDVLDATGDVPRIEREESDERVRPGRALRFALRTAF